MTCKFANVLDKSRVATAIIKHEKIYYVNPKFKELFGYTKNETLINSLPKQFQPKRLVSELSERGISRIESKNVESEYFSTGISKDGKEFPILVRASKIDLNDEPAILVHIEDSNLKTKVDNLQSVELENQLINERIRSLQMMMGGIAHDFNNLLLPILTNVDLLTDFNLADIDLGLTRDILKEIKSSAIEIRDITHQLLTYAGKKVLDTSTIEINSLIQQFDEIGNQFGIDIEFETIEQKLTINIDEDLVSLAIKNILQNSLESMDNQGTIKISTGLYSDELDSNIVLDNISTDLYDYAYISIEDSGGGIPDDKIDKIFDPFYTDKKETRGLGLAIVYGIMREHSGSIAVSSEMDLGTKMTLVFPVHEDTEYDEEKIKIQQSSLDTLGNILLVDDHKMVTRTIKRVLNKQEYSVIVANSGKQGLIQLKENKNNIFFIILDIKMPDISGLDFIEIIKRVDDETMNRIPILLISGYSDEKILDLAQLNAKNQIEFLHKPFNRDELLEKIEKII